MIPWVLGAPSEQELRGLARRIGRHVGEVETDPYDLGYTLVTTRPPDLHRAVVFGRNGDFAEPLLAVASGQPTARAIEGVAAAESRPAFVFPGQGAIFPEMAGELFESSPVFARRLVDCADALAPHIDWSLVDVVRATSTAPDLHRADVVEPVLFAIMVALAELWTFHGVRPRAVVGYSLGEVAAACVSGALTLDEAARVAVIWSRAHLPLVGRGAMAQVALPAGELQSRLDPWRGDVSIAGVIAPCSAVVSGGREAVALAVQQLRGDGVYAQQLSVDFPAHCARVEPQRESLLVALGTIVPRSADVPFYSSVTGGPLDTRELQAEYWYRNLRQPVLFERATRAVLADGHQALIELSPHPVLVRAMQETVDAVGGEQAVLGSLRRDQQGMSRFLTSLAEAHVAGVAVAWERVFNGRGRRIALPELDGPAVDVECRPAPARSRTSRPAADRGLMAAVCGYVLAELGRQSRDRTPSSPPVLAEQQQDQSLFDLGFNSIQLVELQAELQDQLGIELESTFIIDHPTARAVAREMGRRLGDEQADGPAPTRAPSYSTEPVAVVGMSCRLPGNITNRDELWSVLSGQVDVVEDVPADRWRHSSLDVGEVTTTQGGYVREVDRFDPLFFNISPNEAELIDPQQRLLLELTWEAFEDAGVDPLAAGENSRVGTFVGIISDDYVQVGKDLGYTHEAYTYTGNMANAAAGRISYAFGFRGPSIALDTACSSSLYALHLGSRELRQGGCDLVVAAAVNLILSPEAHLSWSRLGALSPSGRCRSFDDSADGYIRSEGGGVVILKRLSDAERDGDDILAVLRGSAVNHNGNSGGFTVPSGTAQTGVIQQALADSGLGIEDISYVEAHGSGTPIGDPQEINALARVFAGRESKVHIGSVKSNLGHLEAAAGMAALCKVLVSLEHRRLPATLHFREGNRLVDWARVPVEVVAEEIPWTPTNGRRRAGISSFGISGTNAHLVVEEYVPPEPPMTPPGPAPDLPRLLPVSASSPAALRTALQNLAEWSTNTSATVADIARTLGQRRSLRHREALLCRSVTDIPAAVSAALEAGRPQDVEPDGSRMAFVFSGQGTQHPGMARELYDHAEVFHRELDELDREFRRSGDIPLLDVMFGDDAAAFGSPLYTQPMIFSVELALARYWGALGVTPDAVIGHSIGEYAASCFAGVMSREQAVDLVTCRARVMEDTPRNGSMGILLCSQSRAEDLLRPYPDLWVAAVNASENITVSGLSDSFGQLARDARKQRIFLERLEVSHPFHSPQMARGAEQLHEQIRDQRFSAPTIPWISGQTGRPVTGESMIDAGYWSRHLVEPVLWRAAVATALQQGLRTFVEIGAMATLSGLIVQDVPDDAVLIPSLRKGRSDVRQLLDSAGRLWKLGRRVEFRNLPGRSGKLVRDLPHTPFERQRVWYRDRVGEDGATPTSAEAARAATSPRDRTAERESLATFVKQALHQVTGAATETMDESLELFSLGVDSLMLVQLGKRVEKEFDVDIPIKTFFESLHTIGLLTDFILQHRLVEPVSDAGGATAPARPAAEPGPAPVHTPPDSTGRGAAPDDVASGVEGIIRSQLAVMEQQLAVLAGGASTPPPPAPAPTVLRASSTAVRKVGSYSNNIELGIDQLTEEQRRFVRGFVADYTARTRQSKAYADAHRETLADWIASLNFNPSLKETVYPLVSSRSSGANFWDLDGNAYVDTTMGYGVHFFGHQPDFIVDALKAQLEMGYELGPQNRVAGEVAELIHELVGADRVAFCNTGTEAVMVSIRLARAVSGRTKVARFTTSYHGSYDGVLAEADGDGDDSMPTSIGIPQSMVEDTIVLGYDRPESLERIRRHGHELAAVLVEPVQSRNPALQPREFLQQLRQICTELDIALIFDEMIVGFRVEVGGAQAHFGVEADMSLYGKLVGGGLPIGIVAGRSKYLDAVDGGAWSDIDDSRPAVPTTFFAGTFCKHPLTMAACRAVLRRLRESGAEELAELNRFTDEYARRANAYFEAAGVPLKVAHFASLYRYETVVAQDMGALALTLNLFFKLLAHHGVYVWERRTAFFSLAHTRDHQDRILAAIRASVEALRAGGFDFRRAGWTAPAAEITSPTRPRAETGTDLEPTAISSQEKRVYVLSRMRGGNEAYQILASLRFDGTPDRVELDAAFRAIAAKHPKLRSGYEIDSTDVRARVRAVVTPEVHDFDLAAGSGLDLKDVLAVMNRPFDLERPPLWRYGIVVDRERRHHLVVSFHHIVADGTSVEIILADLAAYLAHGRLTDDVSDDYASFVRLQSEVVHQPAHDEHRQWWLRQFETIPAPLDLATDAPYPVVNDFRGEHHYFELDAGIRQAAKVVIEQQKTTPFVFYLSVWSALLARVTGAEDLSIGVPMDQRMLGSFERTVGMFAQSLPLRIRPTAATRVRDLVQQVRDTTLAAMEHSTYSYDELVHELDLTRDFGRNALFDVMFTFTNAREHPTQFGGVTATAEDFGAHRSSFALNLELTERGTGLFGDLNHSSVYSRERVTELMGQYRALVAQVVQNPDLTVGEFSLVDDATRDRLSRWGTGPAGPVPTLSRLFDDAFTEHAHQPAVRTRSLDLSYADLAERVDVCAALLRSRGVGRGDVVGLLLPASPELVVSMLAVQRIGACWLPMDVHHPPKRLQYMIDTASPAKVVATEELAAVLDLGDRALLVGGDGSADRGRSPAVPTEPHDLAYVIFTSGSTGQPKGVQVTNEALANFLCGMREPLRWQDDKVVGNLTTPSFDIYLLETLLTLVTGGTIVVAEEEDLRTPAAIADFVTRNRVEYLQLTPTRLRLLHTDRAAAARALRSLSKLIVGGEAFPEELLADLTSHEGLEIFNVYGPTETCIWSSVKELTRDTGVSIGTPIANTTFYVLDDNEPPQLVPPGTVGNLWIGGLGVSPGYLNRPDLTEKLFRDDPHGGGRMYLSGDQARWNDGEAYCLGRIDNQVKVRGYRVELEEIERAIAEHDLVTGAAAIVQEIGVGNHVIRGFYQVEPGAVLEQEALRAYLAETLADYMVPATLTPVTEIPTTTSGKVDRQALGTQLDRSAERDHRDTSASVVDRQLVAAWRKVLGDVTIGQDDSFFDLGGNSFSLILLLEELDAAFPGMLDVSDLFANPTIGRLRGHVEDKLAQSGAKNLRTEVGLALPGALVPGQGFRGGRVNAVLPTRVRDALDGLRLGGTLGVDDLAHAAFGLTLHKMFGLDEVTLCVVESGRGVRRRVLPVRLGFVGKSDLADVLVDFGRELDRQRPGVELAGFAAGRTADGLVSMACTSTRASEETDLLRHFDVVVGVDVTADPATVGIGYGRTVKPPSMERLLSDYVKVLGLLAAPALTPERTRS